MEGEGSMWVRRERPSDRARQTDRHADQFCKLKLLSSACCRPHPCLTVRPNRYPRTVRTSFAGRAAVVLLTCVSRESVGRPVSPVAVISFTSSASQVVHMSLQKRQCIRDIQTHSRACDHWDSVSVDFGSFQQNQRQPCMIRGLDFIFPSFGYVTNVRMPCLVPMGPV